MSRSSSRTAAGADPRLRARVTCRPGPRVEGQDTVGAEAELHRDHRLPDRSVTTVTISRRVATTARSRPARRASGSRGWPHRWCPPSVPATSRREPRMAGTNPLRRVVPTASPRVSAERIGVEAEVGGVGRAGTEPARRPMHRPAIIRLARAPIDARSPTLDGAAAPPPPAAPSALRIASSAWRSTPRAGSRSATWAHPPPAGAPRGPGRARRRPATRGPGAEDHQ